MKKTNLTIKFYLRILIIQLTAISISAQVSEIEKLLELDLESLTNISIISATKTVSTINEVPSTVRVITEKTIKENGYLTLEDALSCLPGFQFRNILGFNSYIFQRGIPNQNNLILLLIDGIQVNELNSGGFYAGGQFNLDNVKQIEVIYGPSSSLYGTNAISGIINIITKSTKESKGFSISGLYGSFKTYNVSTAYSYYDESSDFGLRISAMIKSSEKADLKGEDGDYNWTNELENFEDDYSFEIKSDYKNLQLGILYQNKQSSRSTNYKSFGTEFWDKNSLWNISF
ncbi:MAG: TonB-dependent receptor plug domain-containing protein, partial [Melioribacteraceae bacterium]|nr:TonB-dependent receptor plug domain-containing protein [Melioribacteraceae bacterium]